jgi:hypothetical protein
VQEEIILISRGMYKWDTVVKPLNYNPVEKPQEDNIQNVDE